MNFEKCFDLIFKKGVKEKEHFCNFFVKFKNLNVQFHPNLRLLNNIN